MAEANVPAGGRKAGRPSKLTPEVHAAVVQALVNGLSRRHAAACAGVSHRTYNAWRGMGRRGAGRAGRPTATSCAPPTPR